MCITFFFYRDDYHRNLHSFPTRRSSDLKHYKLNKEWDIAILGAMEKTFYPFRNLMLETFIKHPDIKLYNKAHPGYRFIKSDNELTGQNYAKLINSSKIFASCTSIFKLPFIKLFEVIASSTALLCDKPNGAEFLGLVDDFNYIPVTHSNFFQKAKYYLNNFGKLDEIAKNALILSQSNHTTEIRAKEFVETINDLYYGKTEGKWLNLSPSKNYRNYKYYVMNNKKNNEINQINILDLKLKISPEFYEIWLKYGLNNRPYEKPPVVTEYPEIVIYRAVLLSEIAKRINAQVLVEIGTARGLQSITWGKYLNDNNIVDGIIFTCDLDGMDSAIYKTPITGNNIFTRRQLWGGNPYTKFITFVNGDSSKLSEVINSKIDIVFIDGEHTESAVLYDYNNLKKNFTENTVLVFDDCDERFPGVQKAVDNILKQLGNSYQYKVVSFEPAKYKVLIAFPNHLGHNLQFENLSYEKVSNIINLNQIKAEGATNISDSNFRGESDLYIASADRMDRVLRNLQDLKENAFKQYDVYATVIGGLSGLNYLLAINPKKIIFFDVNYNALKYLELILELIQISDNNQCFISRIFGKSVKNFIKKFSFEDLNYQNQEEYLSQSIDIDLVNDTLEKLSENSKKLYLKYLTPFHKKSILDGKRNCRRLLPCWDIKLRVPVGGGDDTGFNEFGIREPNTNTFFYGFGWLESENSFNNIKNKLKNNTIDVRYIDIINEIVREHV